MAFSFQALSYAGIMGDTNLVKIIGILAYIGFGFFFLTQSALGGYTAWAIFKTKTIRPIQGWLGIAVAITSFLPSVGTVFTNSIFAVGSPITALGFSVFFVWILTLSWEFLRKEKFMNQ